MANPRPLRKSAEQQMFPSIGPFSLGVMGNAANRLAVLQVNDDAAM